ncbi:hypothetical protein TNCV_2689161 [Trichonephila clavipes]|nr:hypothetical protein TNCV_2689161 [Trichonephila clavipes]
MTLGITKDLPHSVGRNLGAIKEIDICFPLLLTITQFPNDPPAFLPFASRGKGQETESGKWHGNYGVPVPETGRTSSSELIKNRAELNESDIRVNKIETKDGQDKSCWKKQ